MLLLLLLIIDTILSTICYQSVQGQNDSCIWLVNLITHTHKHTQKKTLNYGNRNNGLLIQFEPLPFDSRHARFNVYPIPRVSFSLYSFHKTGTVHISLRTTRQTKWFIERESELNLYQFYDRMRLPHVTPPTKKTLNFFSLLWCNGIVPDIVNFSHCLSRIECIFIPQQLYIFLTHTHLVSSTRSFILVVSIHPIFYIGPSKNKMDCRLDCGSSGLSSK